MEEKTEQKNKKSRKKVEQTPMKADLYTKDGRKKKQIQLPVDIFGLPWNSDLVHQVISVQRANRVTPTAHAKDRSEVRGGGRKPWRQKGTGRARHGSNRSPIWRKGGVTHGPTNEKVLKRSINKKMKRKALYIMLSKKYKDGRIIFVDSLSFSEPKTSQAKEVLAKLSSAVSDGDVLSRRNNSAYIAISNNSQATARSFRNMGNVILNQAKNMNVLDIARYKYLILESPEEFCESFLSAGSGDKKAKKQTLSRKG